MPAVGVEARPASDISIQCQIQANYMPLARRAAAPFTEGRNAALDSQNQM